MICMADSERKSPWPILCGTLRRWRRRNRHSKNSTATARAARRFDRHVSWSRFRHIPADRSMSDAILLSGGALLRVERTKARFGAETLISAYNRF